ncbi:MAG: hypothetical protein ACI9MF_000508, partial [Gammaproteobacteria bacterium]
LTLYNDPNYLPADTSVLVRSRFVEIAETGVIERLLPFYYV